MKKNKYILTHSYDKRRDGEKLTLNWPIILLLLLLFMLFFFWFIYLLHIKLFLLLLLQLYIHFTNSKPTWQTYTHYIQKNIYKTYAIYQNQICVNLLLNYALISLYIHIIKMAFYCLKKTIYNNTFIYSK